MLGFRLKWPALLPAWILYDTRPFSPSSSSRAITYKITNLLIKIQRKCEIVKKNYSPWILRPLITKSWSPCEGPNTRLQTLFLPHRLVLHDAYCSWRAEGGSVVIFICHKHPSSHWSPAPMRRVHCLICSSHYKVEWDSGLAIQLLSKCQDSAGRVKCEEVRSVRPVVLDGVT